MQKYGRLYSRYRKKTGLFVWSLCILLYFVPFNVWAKQTGSVLLLCSYHQGDELWTDRIVEGVQSVLSENEAEIHIEYLDARRHKDAELLQLVKSGLSHKYQNMPPRLIICADDPALDFLLTHREDFFPDTPIVFCGINNFQPMRIAGHKNVTGINESLDIKETIEIALRLQPGAQHLVAITSDRQAHWRANAKAFRKLIPDFSQRLKIREIKNLTLADAPHVLRTISQDSIVLALSIELEDENNSLTRKEFYRFLSEHSAAPVYALWYSSSGTGILGGKFVSGFHQGEAAARMALRILAGEQVADIPVVLKSPNVPMFDWSVMKRFGIQEKDLPPNSQILFKQLSLYEQYKMWFWLVPGFIILESLLIAGLFINNSRRIRMERSLRRRKAQLHNALDMGRMGHWQYDVANDLFTFNEQFYKIFHTTPEQAGGYTMPSGEYIRRFVHPDDVPVVKEKIRETLETTTLSLNGQMEHRILRVDGTIGHVSVRFFIVNDAKGRTVRVDGVNQDITDHKQAEEAQKKMQSQLVQAQKMRAVGNLAGGVAHDYNNILSVILGYTEIAMTKIPEDHPLQIDLKEVYKAARRSADITRQLLAFARRQAIAPQVVDLNETVEKMLKMLRRLIGEDIDLSWQPSSGPALVFMDVSQLDQILVNLCVNARDAIGGVGKLIIETENVRLDENYCADHPGARPGDFVMLAVSDDGCGMDKETLDNVFEPFFTTKDSDEGTGLGLATVYGIVKQNEGYINVESEPEEGTTFQIYLPRHKEIPRHSAADVDIDEIPAARGETLLVVEDDASVLKLAKNVLELLGYTVLNTTKSSRAMAMAEEHEGKIHLLITDVIMPEMNGKELADNLHGLYPDLKVLFMSGYAAKIIAHRGVLNEGVNFIQKPFSKRDLAIKVRGLLDRDKG